MGIAQLLLITASLVPLPVAGSSAPALPTAPALSTPSLRPPLGLVSAIRGQGLPGFAAPLRTAPSASHFVPPVAGRLAVLRRFDPPAQPWLAGHRGVDLAAEAGAGVRVAGAGTVIFAGPVGGRSVVSVAHANGLRTTYEPLEPTVRTGDRLAAGEPIGVLAAGHAGCPASACLHWGLRRGERYLDPLLLLGLGRVRLLPLVTPGETSPASPPDRVGQVRNGSGGP